MTGNIVRSARHVLAIEQIALFEPFVAPSDPPLATDKKFASRIVFLDRSSVLSEETPEALSDAYGFRMVVADRVDTNPTVSFKVETFEPTENFAPSRPFSSRLCWKDQRGVTQSKLMVSSPESLVAIVVRGDEASETLQEPTLPFAPRKSQRPRGKRLRAARPGLA